MTRLFIILALVMLGVARVGHAQGVQPATVSSLEASRLPSGWFNYAAWGDSLTYGSGGTTSYPTILSTLTGQTVYNNGVGSQTSTQIAVRQGGVSTTVTVSGGRIPASGGVTVTFPAGYAPATANGPSAGVLCSIAGVPGKVTYSGGIITFTRTTTGSVVSVPAPVPFIVDTQQHNNGFVIIWVGRNNVTNPAQTKADIAAMVASLSHTRYLILSVTNKDVADEYVGGSTYKTIVQLNADLAALYPNNYLDIRSYLVSLYDSGSPQDVIDHDRDLLPTSLRSDGIHLNTAGYTAVANRVHAWLTANDSVGRRVTRLSDTLAMFRTPPLFAAPVRVSLGTLTADTQAVSTDTTWNNPTVTFTHLKANILDTASSATSRFMDLQVGGYSRFTIYKSGTFQLQGQTKFINQGDGVLALSNGGATDFNRLQFGGVGAGFPALKRNAGSLEVRTADDSGYAQLNASTANLSSGIKLNGAVSMSATAPTISSGFGTTPSIVANNGTAAFVVNVGTGGTANSGVIGLPAATTGWNCFVADRTGGIATRMTETTTTSATITAASAWATNSILSASCFAY